MPAYASALPELDHNEIVRLRRHARRAAAHLAKLVMLRDPRHHRQMERRFDLTRELVEPHVSQVLSITAEGQSPLARMLDLVMLGDYASLYLALLRAVDPGPVEVIERLKERLAETGYGRTADPRQGERRRPPSPARRRGPGAGAARAPQRGVGRPGHAGPAVHPGALRPRGAARGAAGVGVPARHHRDGRPGADPRRGRRRRGARGVQPALDPGRRGGRARRRVRHRHLRPARRGRPDVPAPHRRRRSTMRPTSRWTTAPTSSACSTASAGRCSTG